MSEQFADLPATFLDRMQRLIPATQWDSFLETFRLPRRTAIRINTLCNGHLPSSVACRPVPWSDHSFSVPDSERESLVHLPECSDGRVYIQSLSSQLAALALRPQPGEQILDLAAAPGGKASHMAALMNNKGMLSCVEPIRNRFFRLQNNLKKLGVTIARFYMTDGRTVGKKVGERFDRVMLDAPCSGEARFSMCDAESFRTWSPRKIREVRRKQVGLIRSAFDTLRTGGYMLYSTCSFSVEENEAVVQSLIDACPDRVRILPITLNGVPLSDLSVPCMPALTEWEDWTFSIELRNALRILPDDRYEGFFLALIQKV